MTTINFYLQYHTVFGEELYILGNNRFLGDNDPAAAVKLNWLNQDYWYFTLDLPDDFDDTICYKYIFKNKEGLQIFEGEENRSIDYRLYKNKSLVVRDIWNAAENLGNIFSTRAFTKTLLEPVAKVKVKKVKNPTHEFRVKAPLLKEGETLCLCGSTESLANWSLESPILLSPQNNWYVASVSLNENEWPATYKYAVYNLKEKKIVDFEKGENRILQKQEGSRSFTLCHDGFVKYAPQLWRGAGVSIPVFSLRSQKSFGVGEFTDIKLLIDWAKKTGLKLIQLLPINDTTVNHTWKDSYPYAAISAFALHPLYISLESVAGKRFAQIIKPLKRKQKQLNALAEFDYEQVMRFKLSALRELYEAQKEEFKKDEEYFEFFALNRHWLVPYAAFSYLRDKYKTADFTKWKTNSKYNESKIQRLVSPSQSHYDSVAFYYFIQFHLHRQMKDVSNYAHHNKVVLKGDIPIGIYRHGCDAWENPQLYNMDEQAGAPPDDFAVKGQNWGFPTYNWEKMKGDDYKWWRERFDQMSNYFDAFRIDHILGFFRIWSIPMSAVEGILGRFVPAIPVDISEFSQNNIFFDYDRYCKPYITETIIGWAFGDKTEQAKKQFLDFFDGKFQLKAIVNTQAKVEEYFSQEKIDDEKLKHALFYLISNVILLEENNSGGRKFHFRFAINETSSFHFLDDDTKNRLKNLYIDYFYRRQDYFWKEQALNKLPQLMRKTRMLICGEDLGMVPHCVPEVMHQLSILGLEVQRMPKEPNSAFFHPKDAPYLSVVTPSTHDMSTVRGWWEEDRAKTQQFYNQILGHYGEAPFFCEPWVNREIVLQHLYSPAMWSIFQLADLLGIDEKLRRQNPHEERINIPSDPNHYWHYRMHLNLESLMKENDFNEQIVNFIKESGR